jgi:hypothetical protein
MRRSALLAIVLWCIVAIPSCAEETNDGWKTIFDGKTLDGWKANENAEGWSVEDGAIKGSGNRSHLFYKAEEVEDCEFMADVKINKGGNSGMYFRTAFGEGWPKGYEAQVNNSHRDPKRTGTLYNFVNVFDQLIEDDTWWNQHIIVKGNHIVIKVNDKTVVDFVDEKNTYKKGLLAFQQHDPGTVVHYKNIKLKHLTK